MSKLRSHLGDTAQVLLVCHSEKKEVEDMRILAYTIREHKKRETERDMQENFH